MSFWYQNGVCSNKEHSHRRGHKYARQGAGALTILCTLGGVVWAQDVPPGLVARFDVTQRLEYSDNPDFDVDGESDFFGRTILGFGLDSVTNVQRFSLNLGTDIEEGRENESSINVDNSFANLRYNRNTRNALLGAFLGYRETDTETSFFDDFDPGGSGFSFFDLFDPDGSSNDSGNVINQDSGTRKTYRYGLDWAIGREAPIGASFNWSYNEITYSDTNDPDLTDQSTNDFRGQVDFLISPRITTSLTGEYIDFDAQDNGVNRETTRLGVATALEINPILTADIGLSYDTIERTGDETGTDKGTSVDLGLVRAMTNGSVGVRFRSDVESNDNGRRSFLSVDREMELPRGALSYSLGLTGAGDVIGTDPLVNVNYLHQLSTATLEFGMSQNVNVDSDNDEQLNTAVRAAYNQQINNTSSFSVDAVFFDRNDLSATDDDGQRIDLRLSYRHDLTRDWGLVSGISHDRTLEDDGDDRRRTTVFVGLQRSFDWRP